MEIRNFQIALNNSSQFYYAGENISGFVHLNFTKTRKVVELSIELKGYAEVHWSTTTTKKFSASTPNTYNTASEVFYVYNETLLQDDNYVEIDVGYHSYPFSTTLPKFIPTSFEGKCGSVCYVATATLIRPWSFVQQTKIIFHVLNPVDLNLLEGAKKKVVIQQKKKFGSCCCHLGEIEVLVNMPCSGFTFDQPIRVVLTVKNESKLVVKKVIIALYKVIEWRSQYPINSTKHDVYEIIKKYLGSVKPQNTHYYDEELAIPYMSDINLMNCSIISCEFHLTIRVLMGRFHGHLLIDVPLYFGNVPVNLDNIDAQSNDYEPYEQIIIVPALSNLHIKSGENMQSARLISSRPSDESISSNISTRYTRIVTFSELEPIPKKLIASSFRSVASDIMPDSLIIAINLVNDLLEDVLNRIIED